MQGRFLRTSENEDLFIGMEVPRAVTLGVVTRALSRVILGVVCALSRNMEWNIICVAPVTLRCCVCALPRAILVVVCASSRIKSPLYRIACLLMLLWFGLK